MRTADADRVLAFVRAGAAPARRAAEQAARAGGDADAQAERLVGHWRREVAVLTAAPGFAGRLSDVLVDLVGATAQGLLVLSLCALAGEDDEAERTRLVAEHVLGDRLPDGWRPGTEPAEPAVAAEPVMAAVPDDDPAWRRLATRAPSALLGALRTMWAVRRLTGDRAEGRLWQRALAYVPVVGVVGRLTGERHALAGIARDVRAELAGGQTRKR